MDTHRYVRNIYKYFYTYIKCVIIHIFPICIHTYISLLCHLRRPISSNIPAAISTPRTHTFISSNIPQKKKPRLLGEMTDSRAEASNTLDKPGISCSARKKYNKQTKTTTMKGICQKDTPVQLKELENQYLKKKKKLKWMDNSKYKIPMRLNWYKCING